MRARAFAIFTFLLFLPLAACGQKGPLYLDEQLPEQEPFTESKDQ